MLPTLLLRPLFFGPLLALIAVSQASAQSPITSSETFKTIIGKWVMSNADRDRTCQITFKADPSGALFKLDLDKACTAQIPELKDVVGWTIGSLEFVKLMDSRGKALFEFSEVENGMFEAQRPGEGVFFMQNAGATSAAAKVSRDQMAGDWSVVRGSGKTVCVITLTNTAAGEDAFALSLKPGCQNFVTGFAPRPGIWIAASWYSSHRKSGATGASRPTIRPPGSAFQRDTNRSIWCDVAAPLVWDLAVRQAIRRAPRIDHRLTLCCRFRGLHGREC